MANFFSHLFGSKSQSVLGIDIGSSSIKLVQLSRKGGHPILETYGELSLGPYVGKNIGEATNLPTEKIIAALVDMLKEKEVRTTTRLAGVAIPFSSSLIAVIEMPDVPKSQLAEMVPIEARKYVPVPITEVTLDWYIIPKNDHPNDTDVPAEPAVSAGLKKVEVLIVALHNDTLTRYKDIVAKSELEASFFEIEIFSTMRATLDQELTPTMIIDLGATSTKLYVVERGILNASHMITQGSQNITNSMSQAFSMSIPDAEVLKREKGLLGMVGDKPVKDIISTTLSYIFSEANRFVLAYQKKYNKSIHKVVLVGGGSALKGIVEVAKTSFQIEVVVGDPFSKVVAPVFLAQVLRDTGAQFAVSIGVALRRLQELE